MGVQPRVLAGCLGEFVEQHVDALGPSCHGPQRVQRADVARALPDPHQRSLPVQPRHAGFLDIAVAAKAFHRLGGVRGGTLAHPVLRGGQTDAAQQALALVAAHRGVGGTGHPHRDDGGGFGLDRQVGQHIAHQRLVNQIGAERLPVLGVMNGPGQAGAHAGRAAQCAVEPGEVDHLDDGRHTAALLADQPRGGAVVLDFRRGVSVVAELVLEALQEHSVAAAVGQHSGQEETGESAGRLSQDQEDVAHRR